MEIPEFGALNPRYGADLARQKILCWSSNFPFAGPAKFLRILFASRLDERGVAQRHEREAGSGGREMSRICLFANARRIDICGRSSRVVLTPHGWR